MQLKSSDELSLHIARFLHAPTGVRRSPARWRLLPDLTTRTFPDACAILAAFPKPVIFAPLTEPGSISVIPFANTARDVAAAWHRQDQVSNFDPFLSRRGIAEDDTIAFGRVDDVIEMSVASLRQWTHDYRLPLQLAIVNDAARPRYHWLVVRHGDGSLSHGATCSVPTQE